MDTCQNCNRPLLPYALRAEKAGDRIACSCGSTARRFSLEISEGITLHYGFEVEKTRESLKKKERLRWKEQRGFFSRRDPNRPGFVFIDWIMDHESKPKWYKKKVVDFETGKVEVDVDYPLSEHRGHGSAKFRKESK